MNSFKIVVTDNKSGEVIMNKDADCIFGITAHEMNEDEVEISEMSFSDTPRSVYMKVLLMAMKRSKKHIEELLMDFVKSMPDTKKHIEELLMDFVKSMPDMIDDDEDLADEE